jgi:Sulfatase
MCNVDRRGFCLALWALSATTSFPAFAITTPKKLPNIVYALGDDMGWGDIDAYNRFSQVPTPNANRLATEGMRFTDMRAMATAAAIIGKPLPSNTAEDSFNLLPVFLGRQLRKPIRNAINDQAVDGMLTIREGSWKRGWGLESSVVPGVSRLHPVAQLYNLLRSYTIYRVTAGPCRHVNK